MEVITLHAAPFSFILLGTRLRFQLLLIPSSRDTLRPGPDPSSPEATAVLSEELPTASVAIHLQSEEAPGCCVTWRGKDRPGAVVARKALTGGQRGL